MASSDISQPSVSEAYKQPNNQVTKEPAEIRSGQQHDQTSSGRITDKRHAGDETSQGSANQAPLARGIHGAPPGEEAHGETEESLGRHQELDAEQMGPLDEGQVYDAVTRERKPGSGGQEPDLASDLDRKKAEQQTAREAIQASRQRGEDIGGFTGQTGGPASSVS